jgi:putative phosphoribosyl transferase
MVLAVELRSRQDDRLRVSRPTRSGHAAFEVAQSLVSPLDVLVVRKLRVPCQPELAFGAVGEHGTRMPDTKLVQRLGLSPESIAK